MSRPTVFIADDNALMVSQVARTLAVEHDVVGTAWDGPSAFERTRELKPQVLVLDISLPGESGIAVARRVSEELPDTKIVILTVHEDEDWVEAALAAGAHGYVIKSRLRMDLTRAIDEVMAGGRFVSSLVREAS